MQRTLREVYKSCLSDLIALQTELVSNNADETENLSEEQIREKQPPEAPAKSPTAYKDIRIVNVTGRKGRGWVITRVRSPAQLRNERHSPEQKIMCVREPAKGVRETGISDARYRRANEACG